MADRQGIDVSCWQGNINWSEVADAKDFAIIRCTSGRSNALDSKYPANIKGATEQGLPVGVYRYGYATTVAAARAEAAAVLDAIDGYDMPCGVWYDVEWSGQRSLPRATLTAIIKAFCEAVSTAGYQAGIYCNQDWYDNVLDTGALAEYPFWVARYGSNDGQMHTKPDIDGTLWGWQYTSKGKVSGISGNVDLDVMYGDYFGTAGGGSSGSTTTSIPDNYPAQFQTWLNANYGVGLDVDGIWGSKTRAAAIKALQTELNAQFGAGLAVDGIWGSKTRAACVNVRQGARGSLTRIIQGRLYCMGCDPRGFDGIFGSGCAAAVKRYQADSGLSADGIVGRNTWTAMLAE